MKKFNVVIPLGDGGVELHPMKEWLRQHPDRIPIGLDATASTSHSLRNGLRKLGWSVQETETDVRLVPPESGSIDSTVESVLGEEDERADSDENLATFGLEYQLRDFLAQNLAAIPIEGKHLRLYVDPAGRDGIEYPTSVGSIDILAVDDKEQFVVFELKRARSPDHAIGQVSRYMGWINQTIGRGKTVRGIIVAKSISQNLRYSVSVVPNVSLYEYVVKFDLKLAHMDTDATTGSDL